MALGLGIIFTTCQAYEYLTAPFGINDGGYGSLFYMATGFHGFHVIIGAIFLSVSLIRQIADEFTQQHHFGFEAAAWY
jgi:cytochrome c oxidase subunit 3